MKYMDIASEPRLKELYDYIDTDIADEETIEELISILENQSGYYGFIEHCDILDPEQRIEYIGINKDWSPITLNLDGGGGYNLKEWSDFPLLKMNKPYMVKADGTADYQLDENDYTKKLDRSDSDVSNQSYLGGAFSWIPKIYQKQYMLGHDRYVMYRFTPADGFEPWGFVDFNDEEMDGIWLPMFYGAETSDGYIKSIADIPQCVGISPSANANKVFDMSERSVFYGWPIHGTLNDISVMLAKRTYLNPVYGNGNKNAAGTGDGGKFNNDVVSGGQFYGADDGNHLSKLFHSIILNSNQGYAIGNSIVFKNGVPYVYLKYKRNSDTNDYLKLPDITVITTSGYKEISLYTIIKGFGAFPIPPYKGTTTLGTCRRLNVEPTMDSVWASTLSWVTGAGGNRMGNIIAFSNAGTASSYDYTIAPMILPPPNYKPKEGV